MLKIRAYEDGDAAAVRALFIAVNRELAPASMKDAFEAYIARALSEEMDRVRAYYAGREGGFWVADATDDARSPPLVGFFGLERASSDAMELRRMYVAAKSRRQGVARTLLDRAEAEARAFGARRMVLSTSELQRAALALYEAAGYRLIREEIATEVTNKTVGADLKRFHFEKRLM